MLHHIERSNIRPLRGRKATYLHDRQPISQPLHPPNEGDAKQAYSHGRQPSIAIPERVEAWCVVCDGGTVSPRRGLLTIAVGEETRSGDEPTKFQCHRGVSPKGGANIGFSEVVKRLNIPLIEEI